MSRDLSILRYDLSFGLLENISHNVNRKEENLKLFEFGKIYYKEKNKHKESKFLGIAIHGNIFNDDWMIKSQKANIYHIKKYSK